MILLLQSDLLNGIPDLVNAANETRATALMFVLAIFALIAYILLSRRSSKASEAAIEADREYRRQSLEAEREYRKLESETRQDLADAIRSLKDGLKESQEIFALKLTAVAGTLEDVDSSMERVATGAQELRTEILQIVDYVKAHPSQHEEIKGLLNKILAKLETGEIPVVNSA